MNFFWCYKNLFGALGRYGELWYVGIFKNDSLDWKFDKPTNPRVYHKETFPSTTSTQYHPIKSWNRSIKSPTNPLKDHTPAI
jgi:hypothetical protein